MPLRPFYTQITGFTHYRSCRPSHLSPLLNFLNFASSTLLCVHDAIFPSRLLPSTKWPRSKVPPPSEPHASINKDREVVLFLPAAAAICLLNFNLSVGTIPTTWAPQVLADIISERSNFLTPLSCNSFETLILLDERKIYPYTIMMSMTSCNFLCVQPCSDKWICSVACVRVYPAGADASG